ncbi:MAG: cytochrome c-type biogenesis protein CcmH [Methylotenera sp.]|nr:cytochrome c-type biogenesis protein CcmH [Methylotenera sp.]MDD4927344.1 cytochrome c-type biogenesis protein CcmH [Methylotenera sp.]NOS94831.1 cytochrome c-type biogenesis protein CcmH [Methylotenera sp.]NOU41795.1 cytochrome c-type biogenesis protein CcmH [Methylotenera sp.]
MKLIFRVVTVCCLMLIANVWADEARPLHDDVAVEAQVRRLSEELRCLVCQNQTLADSHSELAEDLRQEIRVMAIKGMSDQQITDYLVERYGDFVRYRPPLKSTTLLLWFGPFALLLGGGIGLFLMLRRRAKSAENSPLSADEARKVNALLNKES